MWQQSTWVLMFGIFFTWACSSSGTNGDSERSRLIRIMTYNIHHANPPSKPDLIDVEAIASVIRKENPDLVALQEVDVFTERSGKDLHQARELAEILDMNYHFVKALDYQGGFYGNAVLSKFPILDSMKIDLPSLPDIDAEDRNWAGIKVEVDGKEFWFGSTHLDFHRGGNNLHQSKTLLKNLESIGIPLVIGGDYNRTDTSESIALFDQQFQRTCDDCPPTIPVTNPNKTIDFLMYRKRDDFQVVSHKVVDERYASDHLPVVAEISLRK